MVLLPEAKHGVIALAGPSGVEVRARHVLVDHLQGSDEAHVEGLRACRLRCHTHRVEDRRRVYR
jgi:hypothetical protein